MFSKIHIAGFSEALHPTLVFQEGFPAFADPGNPEAEAMRQDGDGRVAIGEYQKPVVPVLPSGGKIDDRLEASPAATADLDFLPGFSQADRLALYGGVELDYVHAFYPVLEEVVDDAVEFA